MAYLVIQDSQNTRHTYQLTNAANAPKIAVGNSYIPLTTASGGGLKVSDNTTTYRAMEYKTTSSSESASATYRTTANSPDGLSNVTNLTRVSTSNTIYQTRASTSATLTRASTSATLTRASTYETLTRASTYYIEYQTRESVYSTAPLTVNGTETLGTSHSEQYYSNGSHYRSILIYTRTSKYGYTIYGTMNITEGNTTPTGRVLDNTWISASIYFPNADQTSYSSWTGTYGTKFSATRSHYSTFPVYTTGTSYYTQASTYNTIYYTRESIYGYNTRVSVSGYATRESISSYGTRASTSNTVYETRESVSGYSGVSSSSSSVSASTTTWD